MSAVVYLRAILLAGVITTLLNFNILNCDEELLIGIVSCLFFITIVLLTRQFVKVQFFQEMDMLFMIFAYLLNSIKDSLIEGNLILNWATLQIAMHEAWLLSAQINLELTLTQLYMLSRLAILKRIISLEKLIVSIKSQ
jgi:hypothetical protein